MTQYHLCIRILAIDIDKHISIIYIHYIPTSPPLPLSLSLSLSLSLPLPLLLSLARARPRSPSRSAHLGWPREGTL